MLNLLLKDLKEILYGRIKYGILFIVLIILIISTSSNVPRSEVLLTNSIKMGIANEDNSPYSKLLVEYFKNSESFSSYIQLVEGDEKDLANQFRNGIIDIYLIIPDGFADHLMVMEHLPVKVMINNDDKTKVIILKNVLNSYEKYIKSVEINCTALYDVMKLSGMEQDVLMKKNIEISYELIMTALSKEDFFHYEESGDFKATSLLQYYIFVIISISLLYGGLYLGLALLKERKNGTFLRLAITGTPMWKILAQKILLFTGLFFTLLCVFFSILKSNEIVNISLSHLLLLFVIPAFSAAFSIFISSLFKQIKDYILVSNFLGFVFIVLGGGIIPIMYLPNAISDLSHISPIYWMVRFMILANAESQSSQFYLRFLAILTTTILLYMFTLFLCQREEKRYD